MEDEEAVVVVEKFLSPIATPLAGKKLHTKVYKAVKKGIVFELLSRVVSCAGACLLPRRCAAA